MRTHLPILIAEDDNDDALLIERALRAAGCPNPIIHFADAGAVLNYLTGAGPFTNRAAHPVPVLLILDLKLPDLSGFDILQAIRLQPELRALQVVIFSGSRQQDDINRAYELGVNSYLAKPADPSAFESAVKVLHQYWMRCNHTSHIF